MAEKFLISDLPADSPARKMSSVKGSGGRIWTLSRGLGVDSNPRQRRRKLIEKIAGEQLPFDTSRLPAPETLIRQDRQR